MSVALLEIGGTDRASKMEHFDYFRGALHLECLISSTCATAYLSVDHHCIVFSGATITGTSEMDSFSEYT